MGREKGEEIVSGCSIVTKILDQFNLAQMTTSLSDLLEGILIECLEGEENG
jgi:exopolyphosphatase/pppGpp-phosphohydrolase